MDERRWSLEDVEAARERLEIIEAIHAALERWPEVSSLVHESESVESLLEALRDLLGISPTSARAVSDLQVRQVTRERRRRVEEDLEELRAQVRRAATSNDPGTS